MDLYFFAITALVVATLVGLLWSAGVMTRFRQMAVLILFAVLMPLQIGAGPVNAVVLSVLLFCVQALVRRMLSRSDIAPERSRVVVAVMLFMGVAVVAFVAGQYPWFPTAPAPITAQIGGLMLFVLSGGVFLFVAHELGSVAELQRLTWWFIGTGAVAVVTSMTGFFDVAIGRIAVIDASSIGSMFWTWIVAISVSQALFNTELPFARRLAILAVGALAMGRGLVFASDWISGWLPPLVALGIIVLWRFPKTTVSLGLVAAAPILLYGGHAYQTLAAEESYSSMTRFEALGVMWQLIRQNPWLGYGPANYYHYTLLFPILGWWVRFNSHNNYIDIIAQTGVIGMAAFLWFVVEAFRVLFMLRARLAVGFAHAYVIGATAALTASLVAGVLADWIVPFTYNIGLRGFRSSVLFWFFLGGTVALRRLTARTPAPVAARRVVRASPAFVHVGHAGTAIGMPRRRGL